jgi:hypothetical protein
MHLHNDQTCADASCNLLCLLLLLQVRCHPWFTEHLPRYLAVMQADTAVTSPRLDEEMIHEVCACSCNVYSSIMMLFLPELVL